MLSNERRAAIVKLAAKKRKRDKGAVRGAAIGGALLGPAGAGIGAWAGKSKNNKGSPGWGAFGGGLGGAMLGAAAARRLGVKSIGGLLAGRTAGAVGGGMAGADFMSDVKSKKSKKPKKKEAKLRVSDIEDEVGFYATDKQEAKIRDLIKQKKSKSFILRHPILTGVPTLGIAPAVAKGRAVRSITRTMSRKDKKFGKAYKKNKDLAAKRQHELDVAEAGSSKNYSTTNIDNSSRSSSDKYAALRKEANVATMAGKAIDWAARVGGRGAMKARSAQKLQSSIARSSKKLRAGGPDTMTHLKNKRTKQRMLKRVQNTATSDYGGPAAAEKIRKARMQAAGGAGLLGAGYVAGKV